MCMLNAPMCHFIKQPKAINTEGNKGEEPPFNITAKLLCTVSIKVKSFTIDNRITANPASKHNLRPRECNAEGAYRNQEGCQSIPDIS